MKLSLRQPDKTFPADELSLEACDKSGLGLSIADPTLRIEIRAHWQQT